MRTHRIYGLGEDWPCWACTHPVGSSSGIQQRPLKSKKVLRLFSVLTSGKHIREKVYPLTPQFYYVKVGCKGVYIPVGLCIFSYFLFLL